MSQNYTVYTACSFGELIYGLRRLGDGASTVNEATWVINTGLDYSAEELLRKGFISSESDQHRWRRKDPKPADETPLTPYMGEGRMAMRIDNALQKFAFRVLAGHHFEKTEHWLSLYQQTAEKLAAQNEQVLSASVATQAQFLEAASTFHRQIQDEQVCPAYAWYHMTRIDPVERSLTHYDYRQLLTVEGQQKEDAKAAELLMGNLNRRLHKQPGATIKRLKIA